MKNAQARLTVLAASVAALTMSMSVAANAASVGPADDTFYTAPALDGSEANGTLLSYRTTTVSLGKDGVANKAWNILYKSSDSVDAPNVVSGTIIVPTAAWSGSGARPVLIYTVGTHGLANGCAPSRQLAKGSDYEAVNMNAALKQGYAVLVTDYEGYLAGGTPTYLAGKSQAHAALDMVRAAKAMPGTPIAAGAKMGVFGFSQGGQTAAWVAELNKSYAPDVTLSGVAAGGIPADFVKAAYMLDGSVGAAFLAGGVVGLSTQYPDDMPVDLIASDAGTAALEKLKTQCVFEALFDLQNKSLTAFTNNNIGLDQILKVGGIKAKMVEQNLGTNATSLPLYLFHGKADEFIGVDQTTTLKNAYCAGGNRNVQFDLYPSEHIVTMTQGAVPALAWMADRFNGKAAPNNCSITTIPTGNPASGKGTDLIVNLDKWSLAATLHLKTLNQDVVLPASSTMTGVSNINKKSLTGTLNVPDFKAPITLIGLKIQTGIKVTPVGGITGSTALDNNGILTIAGSAKTDITVTSLLGIPFGECKTVSPVEFKLNYTGPIGELGAGGVTFKGDTGIPQIKGCGVSGILTALMTSTKGNTYTFSIAPPAPKSTY